MDIELEIIKNVLDSLSGLGSLAALVAIVYFILRFAMYAVISFYVAKGIKGIAAMILLPREKEALEKEIKRLSGELEEGRYSRKYTRAMLAADPNHDYFISPEVAGEWIELAGEYARSKGDTCIYTTSMPKIREKLFGENK